MGGGDAALAVGLESRREELGFTPSALLVAGQIRGDGAASAFSGSRRVNALFGELSLPFSRTFEGQLAARYDNYSDVGNTVNPKVGMRWNPARELLVRASYGTGFRAPTLSDLYTPVRLGQTNGVYDDLLGCIKTPAIDNTNNPDYCGIQPDKLRGGNPNLKPEKSKQLTVGLVFEPTRTASVSLDYWRIKKTDVITYSEGAFFENPVFYRNYITRDAPDPALRGIPGFILEIDARPRNTATLDTSGIDLGVEVKFPATSFGKFGFSLYGTYVIDYVTGGEGSFVNGVGKFSNDQVVQRWRHLATFNYDNGPWAATLSQTFSRGYTDQNPNPDGSPRRVGDYELWDLTGSYAFTKALRVRAGVKNLLDRNPPVSNQIYSFLAGYDPNYTDPRGRLFFGSVSYSFK